jgi:ribonuclease Z
MTRLTFVGTGEAFDPERPNTSLLVEGAAHLLLDCGYAVPHAFWRWTQDPSRLDAIFLSHAHADHCFGLPALVVWMRLAGRARPLRLLGGPGARAWIPRVLETGYEGAYVPPKCFPIEIDEVSPGTSYSVSGFTLRTALSAHSVPNYALRIDTAGASVAYSGDGAPTADTEALFAGADHLVHECFGVAPAVKGHACLEDVTRCASAAEVRSLHLVHLSREPEIRARVLADVARGARTPAVAVPDTGTSIELG